MNYFTKIEAYFNGELNDLERLVFEQELVADTTLQEEVAAYEMAQSLFEYTAETLPEEEIVGNTATVTADEIIAFTASHLSEEQILGKPKQATQPTIVQQLKPRRNRTAWLVAASMLFIISMIGLRYQNNPASLEPLERERAVAENKPEKTDMIPLEKEVMPNNSVEEIAPKVEVSELNQFVVTTPSKEKVEKSSKAYQPAKVKVIKKQKKKAYNLVANTLEILPDNNSSAPLAVNTTVTEIKTSKVISAGENVEYKAENAVVLEEGFYTGVGGTLVAKTVNETTVNDENFAADYTSSATITGTEKVVYKANETITLKPGFHAKVGTDFVAKTAAISNEVATNTVISDKESVLVKANNSITLKPGFHAKAGADFTATVAK